MRINKHHLRINDDDAEYSISYCHLCIICSQLHTQRGNLLRHCMGMKGFLCIMFIVNSSQCRVVVAVVVVFKVQVVISIVC